VIFVGVQPATVTWFRNLASVIALFSAVSFAQITDKLNISVGGGVSSPAEEASQDLHTGYNWDINGGYNVNRHLSLNLDWGYQHWGLNDAALARFEEPGGRTTVWSLTFNPVLHLNSRGKFDVYTTAGYGLYHSNLSLTEPFNETIFVCDPFFGFCFPQTVTVNEVVASFSTYKGGFNVGGGFSIPLLRSDRVRFFTEARYHRMFSSSGADITYVPVTFGIRW
jgi:opacity protein-like surface antigen